MPTTNEPLINKVLFGHVMECHTVFLLLNLQFACTFHYFSLQEALSKDKNNAQKNNIQDQIQMNTSLIPQH